MIVQARMSSKRLPGKVLMPIGGQPMVLQVLRRASAIGLPVIMATSTHASDDPLADTVERSGWPVSRGDRFDVLDRFVNAAPDSARFVVRVTADCPLFDPNVGRGIVHALLAGGIDYVSNTIVRSYPDGLDCEAFTTDALRQAWREARMPEDREHVTPYLRNHPELFRIWNIAQVPDRSAERWTVDEAADLAFVQAVYERLGTIPEPRRMEMNSVLDVLATQPELRLLNAPGGHADLADPAH